jgi:hypothetical protein
MGKHIKFARTRAAYAQRYACGLGTLDDWIARGKKADDPPPLDEPADMGKWWTRVMHGPVPQKFREVALKVFEQRDFSEVRGLSMQDNVAALRVTLAINKQLLDEALATKDESTVGLRQRNYERCFNLLRLAEQSLLDLQKRQGELIDREKVVDDLTKMVESYRLMRERMTRDIMISLEGRCSKRMRRALAYLREHLEASIEEVRRGEELFFARGLRDADT